MREQKGSKILNTLDKGRASRISKEIAKIFNNL